MASTPNGSKWQVEYRLDERSSFKMELKRGSSKQIGLFPEQAPNWSWIYKRVNKIMERNRVEGRGAPSILNLFAYTGGASLAAKCAGADVTHVESVRQTIALAKANMEASSLEDIRWVQEDALKFIEREVKRGRSYQGVILDPPAYGLGPKGERWQLKESIDRLLSLVAALLERQNSFLLLNLYTTGYTPKIADTLLRKALAPSKAGKSQYGTLTLEDSFGKILEMSHFARVEL